MNSLLNAPKLVPSQIFLAVCLTVFFAFQIIRISDQDVLKEKNYLQRFGDFRFTIDKVKNHISDRITGIESERFTFNSHNPGLFILIPYVATLVFPNAFSWYLYFIIFLSCSSILLHYLWVRLLFDDFAAIYSTLFLVVCPFFVSFSVSFFAEPWDFFFLPLTMIFYLLYLKNDMQKYFVASWFSFLCLCSSYYMYDMSGWILLLATGFFKTGRLNLRHAFWFGLAALIPVSLVVVEMIVHSDISSAFKSFLDVATYRTKGLNTINYPFEYRGNLFWDDFSGWINMVQSRLGTYFYYDLRLWLGVGFLALFLRQTETFRRKGIFLFAILVAGLSWLFVIRQHSFNHTFTGGYSYFCWMLFFGCAFGSAHRNICSHLGTDIKLRISVIVFLAAINFLMPMIKISYPIQLLLGKLTNS